MPIALAACQPAPAGGDAQADANPTPDASRDVAMEDAARQDAPTAEDVAPPPDVPAQPDAQPAGEGEIVAMEAPSDIAVAGGHVYYARNNLLRRVPTSGGMPTTVFMSASNAVSFVAADANGVVWTEYNPNSSVSGAVRACPLAGCPATPMGYRGGESTNEVAVSATRVAWTSGTLSAVFASDRATGNMSAGVPASSMFERRAPSDVQLDGDEMFWTTAGMIGTASGTVLRCNLAGGACAPTELARGAMIGRPQRLAVVPGGDVLFLSGTGLFRVGRDGTGLTRLTAVDTGNSMDLVTDGTNAYWAINGTAYRCALAACTPRAIMTVSGQFTRGLALDATHVYWGTATFGLGSGAVRRVPR